MSAPHPLNQAVIAQALYDLRNGQLRRCKAMGFGEAELDALKASSSTPRYRVKRWFSRLFGLGADDLQKRADELRGQIRLAKARGDECRCLTCAGVHTFPLTFDENGVCTGFQHDCGGHLKLDPPDMDAPRFNYGRETIHLDEAGKRIQ